MTYSFDVFDTCLIRACGMPHFVFNLLAERILGKDASESELNDFAWIRRKAEGKARLYLKEGWEDVTLQEIYDACDFTAITNTSNDEIMRNELLLERELLIPVESIKQKIKMLHSGGVNVIFISDMYLPKLFLISILKENGLFKDGDKLYVSSECRKTKSSGHLYEYVAEQEYLRKKSWTHFGDNIYSDVKIPCSLGIKARHIQHPWSRSEHLMAFTDIMSDRFSHKLCASFSRSIRLSKEINPIVDFASDFIAPLHVSFVANILYDASRRGIKRIYFLARDAQIFYNIAKILKDDYPEIEIGYLYVSRKSLYLPGLDEFTTEELNKLAAFNKRLDGILDCFQMEDTIEHFRKYEHLEGNELISALLEDNDFVQILNSRQKEQETLCLEYFQNEGLASGNAAIVDLNGTRRCHKAINKILSKGGFPQVFAYYFVLYHNRICGNDYMSLHLEEHLDLYRPVYRLPPILLLEEYFCMAEHETTVSYTKENNKIVPVLGTATIPQESRNKIFNIHTEVCSIYAHLYKKYINPVYSRQICEASLLGLSDFLDAPDKYHLNIFKEIVFSYNALYSDYLIKKMPLLKLLRRKSDVMWFSGNLVYNSPLPHLTTSLLRIIRLLRIKMKFNI